MSDGARSHGTLRAAARLALVLSAALLLSACAGRTSRTVTPTLAPGPTAASPAPTTSLEPTFPPAAGAFGSVPVVCYGLGEADCRSVAGHVAAVIDAVDPRVRYVQVGPFGCADGQGCPTTLAGRPEGDVVVETATGTQSFHVKSAGDTVDVRAQEAFGIDLAPSSSPPLAPVPQPFTLGHCGLWSGIDIGGSWWDPVGLVDSDHGDAINAAEGVFAPLGIDRATFTSKGGLVVQLVRRDGEKYLPLCR